MRVTKGAARGILGPLFNLGVDMYTIRANKWEVTVFNAAFALAALAGAYGFGHMVGGETEAREWRAKVEAYKMHDLALEANYGNRIAVAGGPAFEAWVQFTAEPRPPL